MFPEWEANYDTGSIRTYPHAATIDSSDNIYALGRYTDTTTEDIFITKINTFGQQEWFRRYSWWAGYQVPYSIKQLQNGRFLVSGSVGSQTGTMEIDENGTVTRPFSIFYTPPVNSVSFGTLVTPLPHQKYLFRANQFNRRYQFGIADISGNFDWMVSGSGIVSSPAVYSDENSFVVGFIDSLNITSWLTKYNFNGQVIWTVPNPAGPRQAYSITDVIPTYSGNGIAYGSRLDFSRNQFIGVIQWIANVGRPAPPLYLSQQQGVVSTQCFPNPARGNTVISLPLNTGYSSVQVTLTSQLGQQHQRTATPANGGFQLPLHDLPAGLYTLQTTMAGKTYRARVVVE